MTERAFVSVVVPVMNEEENVVLLVGAVHSALLDWPTWELILVDDGSSDGTREVIADCSLEDREFDLWLSPETTGNQPRCRLASTTSEATWS